MDPWDLDQGIFHGQDQTLNSGPNVLDWMLPQVHQVGEVQECGVHPLIDHHPLIGVRQQGLHLQSGLAFGHQVAFMLERDLNLPWATFQATRGCQLDLEKWTFKHHNLHLHLLGVLQGNTQANIYHRLAGEEAQWKWTREMEGLV